MSIWIYVLGGLAVFLVLVFLYDIFQTKHAILRNFPIIGHFRYMLESVGPELRQYIVANNEEERPFSRDERRWVYSSAKKENNYFGFGTDNNLEVANNYVIIKHAGLVKPEKFDDEKFSLPCGKVLGAARNRKKAFRPDSIISISAMSYGSLSAPAVEAINEGCHISNSLHNTGEGGISTHHDKGGELIWQIGTGYFGCRNKNGQFDKSKFLDVVAAHDVKAIEIKLSQGAKPGLGGVLPGEKVTKTIALARGVTVGQTCISPAGHTAFTGVDGLLEFVETLADETGLPVGIKAAVGQLEFWHELADRMAVTKTGVDYIAIDGGEGGTGAAPLVFSDHVALPFKQGMSRVYPIFVEKGLHQDIVFIGSGRLGYPQSALLAMGLGCDMIAVAREALLSIGCIQALRCHTGHCPTGIATQNRWLVRGLDPSHKAARLANYVITLRKELTRLSHACGFSHPALVSLDHLEVLKEGFQSVSAPTVFGYQNIPEHLGATDKSFLLERG